MNKRITLFNQVTGPLFIDVANTYLQKYDDVILVTGSIEPTYAELDERIKIIYKTPYKRHKSYLRISTWLMFFMSSFFYILMNRNIGKVLLVSNPPILPFLGSIFNYRKNFSYDVLIYDVYPDALENFGYLKKSSLLFSFWDKLNKLTFESAVSIFTISDGMMEVISRTAPKEKIRVVYPWVDTSFIKPKCKKDNWFVEKHNLVNKKVILYSGNMGVTHDLFTVLKAAERLKITNPEFHFLFIGDGTQKENLLNFRNENKLDNVTFLPFQDPEVLPYSFTSADFGVVSLGSGAEVLSVPSKTFYQLAAGLALISVSERGSEMERLVNENNCGITVKPGDIIGLISNLKSIDDHTLVRLRVNSRRLSSKFTVENAKQFL